MKRIQSACIMQIIRFQQKEGIGLSHNEIRALNHAEVERFKEQLEVTKKRYRIDSESEEADGSILVSIRKEYNEKTNIGEYLN